MSCSTVQVRVPASTSNLGPGFDCLGLALNLHNTTTLVRDEGVRVPRGMMEETAHAFFQRGLGGKVTPFHFTASVEGDVPVSRGLGSSVTVRLGVLMGLAELVRDEVSLTSEQILSLLIELEGHPDNAVPSLLGGFAVCAPTSEGELGSFAYTRVKVEPQLAFVALVPELRLSTEVARGLLPKEVSFRHAVENSQRTARISMLFATRDYAGLQGMFADHLHQPYRRSLIPGFAEILGAAQEAGALGSFLSGAGSTMMAVTLGDTATIASAMQEAAKKNQLPAQVLVLHADNAGAQVLGKS